MKNKIPKVSFIATIVTMVIAILVIIGWFIHNDFLRSIVPGQVKMKFNVASCFLLSSIVLLLNYYSAKNKTSHRISVFLSVIVSLIGAFTLVEYIFGINLGIDEFFVKDELRTTTTYYAGRMSPLSAINFLLIGIGLLLLNKEKAATFQFYYLSCIAFSTLLMLIAFDFITDIPTYITLAIDVTIGFIILCTAIWFAQPMLQKKINFERKLVTGFAAVIILIAVVGMFSTYYSDRRSRLSWWVRHGNNIINEAEQIASLTKDIENGGRGYIITGDSVYLEYFTPAKDNIFSHVKKMRELTEDNPSQQVRIDSLSALIEKRIALSIQYIDTRNKKGFEAASKLMATRLGKFYTDKIRSITSEIQKVEKDLLVRREGDYNKSIVSFKRAFYFFLAGAFALLTIIFFSIRNNIAVRKKTEGQSRENEKQIQTIFNAAPDAVTVIDDQGIVVKWNTKAETLFGWKADEVIGKLLSETIIPFRYRKAHRNGMKHFLKTGEGPVLDKTIEIQAIDKNNVEIDVELSISPTLVNNKYLFIGFVRDITERKKAEEKLKESEEKLRILFNSIDEGFCIIEMIFDEQKKPVDYRFLVINPSFEKQTGLHDAVGKRMREFAPDHEEYWFETYGRIALTGESIRFVNRAEQLHRWYDVYAFRFGEPKNLQVAILFNDITENKRAEELIKKQKQNIQDFIDSMSTLSVKLSTDGKILMVNKIALQASGLSMEELMMTNFIDGQWWTFNPEVHARVREAFKKACSGIAINYDENIFVFGQVLTINFSLIPILKPDGSTDYIVGEGRDITAQKKAEEKIRQMNLELEKRVEEKTKEIIQSEKRFRGLIENSYDMVSIIDKDFKTLYRSLSAYRITGWSDKENERKERMELTHPDDIPALKNMMSKVLANPGKPYSLSFRSRHKDGNYIWIDGVTTNMLHDESVKGIVANFRDVTESKKAEEEIKKLNADLEEKVIKRTAELQKAHNEMEAFSYSVSHDLRAPLRGIIGFTNILDEEYTSKLDAEARRITSIIKSNTLKMGNLIDDLLSFSRTDRQQIIKTNITTTKMVKEIIAELEDKNKDRHISWLVPDLPDIKADTTTIKQVWVNLISNAIKYSKENEQSVIEIGSLKREKETVFFIKDNGVGFDEKYKNKLFKVFQRLHSSSKFEGTGVGLAIVEKIISKHGGKVWAVGIPGKGACFYFTLPE